jgi:4-hydroxy-tetrahydrodipicolinate synthase
MVELGRLLTAMLTPFAADGSVDYDAAKRLALALLDSGSEGVLVGGTTGEAPTLTHDEKLRLFREIKSAVGERGAVIAGTGTYNTAESVDLTREASNAGADAVLAVTPYYNRPPQEGLYRHFAAIADATPLPVIMYNIKSRTGVNMTAETMVRCSQIENIAGVKEASGDFEQIGTVIRGARGPRPELVEGFRVWSGADEDTLSILELGGYGVISVISHLVGRQLKSMIDDAVAGRLESAHATHERLLPLIDALFCVSNPIPVKYALNQLGFSAGGYRLPLCEPDAESAARIMAEVRRHQVDLPVAV